MVTLNLLVGEDLCRAFADTEQGIIDTIAEYKDNGGGYVLQESFTDAVVADAYKRGFDDGYCSPTIVLSDATARALAMAFEAIDSIPKKF